MPSESMLVISGVLALLAITAMQVLAVKKKNSKFLALSVVLATFSCIASALLADRFDRLEGVGKAPGFTYFTETIFCMFGTVLFAVEIVVTIIIFVVAKLVKSHSKKD